MNKMSRKLKTW